MARDRYLWNSGDETIHKDDIAKPTDPKGKWENFWYYNKIKLLVILISCGLVGGFIYEMVTKVEPDYQIAVLTQQSYPAALTEGMGTYLAQFGEDLDGDGQVVVQVNAYNIATGDSAQVTDPSMQMASVAKFSVDLQEGESIIFLTDEASFKENQETRGLFSFLDGSNPSGVADEEGIYPPVSDEDKAKMRIQWKDCKGLEGMTLSAESGYTQEGVQALLEQAGEGLGVSLRQYQDTSLPNKKGLPEYYDANMKLLDRIING